MKNKTTGFYIKLIILGLGIAWLIVAMVSKPGEKAEGDLSGGIFSEDYVNAGELPSMLSFTYRSEEEWDAKLQGQLSEKLTYQDIAFILNKLGIANYVKYEKKKEDEILSRAEFNKIYDQVLALLDTGNTVKHRTEKLLKVAKGASGRNIIMTRDEFYESNLNLKFFEENGIFGIYICDGEIIGIKSHIRNDLIGEQFYDDTEKKPADKKIRVVIKDKENIYRNVVRVTGDSEFTISSKGEKNTYKNGKNVNIEKFKLDKSGAHVVVKGSQEGGALYLTDRSGHKISKGYRGTLIIYHYKDGYVVVNDLLIEDYLCGVVPSEMPESFHMEALKAQAVCARSYVYSQIKSGDYAYLKAHIDDSTRYQEYNKQEENEKASKAIGETKGEILTYQGESVTAYYFSTSCGMTSDYTLWGLSDEKFGYLKKAYKGKDKDLSKEDKFSKFIRNEKEDSYDSKAPYFRWSALLKPDTFESAMKNGIMERNAAATDTVKIKWKNRKKAAGDLSGMGDFIKIGKIKRNESGGIYDLILEYEKGSVTLKSEYTIRYVLGTAVPEVTLKDGTKRENSMLPSAYCTFIPKKNGSYRIYGGGFGHGMGMSQVGADRMGIEGHNYKDILHFYYDGVDLE